MPDAVAAVRYFLQASRAGTRRSLHRLVFGRFFFFLTSIGLPEFLDLIFFENTITNKKAIFCFSTEVRLGFVGMCFDVMLHWKVLHYGPESNIRFAIWAKAIQACYSSPSQRVSVHQVSFLLVRRYPEIRAIQRWGGGEVVEWFKVILCDNHLWLFLCH